MAVGRRARLDRAPRRRAVARERLEGAALLEALVRGRCRGTPSSSARSRRTSSGCSPSGVRDMRPAAMPGRFEEALAGTSPIRRRADAGRRGRRTSASRDARRRRRVVRRLARSPAPPSLDHNDLHPWNVLAGDGAGRSRGSTTGATASSPTRSPSMLVPLGFVERRLESSRRSRVRRVRDAYLESFADLAPTPSSWRRSSSPAASARWPGRSRGTGRCRRRGPRGGRGTLGAPHRWRRWPRCSTTRTCSTENVPGSGPIRSPRSSASIAAISSSVSSKSKTLEVLADPLRRHRLRDHDVAELQVPAEHDLGRRALVARRRSSVIVGSSSTAPWASGLQASVAMPCSACRARSSRCCRHGWSSIWLTAGVTSVSATSRSRCSALEVGDADRARAAVLAASSLEGPPGVDVAVPRRAPASGSGRGRRSRAPSRSRLALERPQRRVVALVAFHSLVVTKTSSRASPEARERLRRPPPRCGRRPRCRCGGSRPRAPSRPLGVPPAGPGRRRSRAGGSRRRR